MTAVFDIAESSKADLSSVPADIAARIIELRYEQMLTRVPSSMLPPRNRIIQSAVGSGGMGTAFGLTKSYELTGWVLKLTVDTGEAAMGAVIASTRDKEIPGLVPVHTVLDLDVNVFDSKYRRMGEQRVFAIWRRYVVPIYDYSDMPMEPELEPFFGLAEAGVYFAEHVHQTTEAACDALGRVAPNVTHKYMRDPEWVRYVADLVRGNNPDGSAFSKAGRSIAAHVATYIAAISSAGQYHRGLIPFRNNILSLLSLYEIALCDIAARNIGLLFKSDRGEPEVVVFDFGVPRFLTKDYDNIEVERL